MEKPEEIKVEEEKLPEQAVESIPSETPEEKVVKNELEAKEDKVEITEEHPAASEDTAEPEANPEGEKLEQKSEEESDAPNGDDDNKDDETKSENNEVAELETKKDEATETDEVDETEQEKISSEQADLIAQLEELRAEKEDREALEACNKEVMRVEEEFNKCSDKILEALKVSFAQNNIDPSKTLEELKKEDPAKATLAMQFISQAQELKAQLENAAIEEIKKQQNEVIYKVAAREFEKTGLNLEQAQEAVKTFKRIVNEVGIVDLGDDLKMKVQMAAGRAKMVIPVEDIPSGTTDLKEPSPEIKAEELVKESKPEKDVPPTPVVEKPAEPVVEKPKTEDFEEGVAGKTSANAGTMINELNVLEELARLPYKEQRKFYKEHEDVISKALSKRG